MTAEPPASDDLRRLREDALKDLGRLAPMLLHPARQLFPTLRRIGVVGDLLDPDRFDTDSSVSVLFVVAGSSGLDVDASMQATDAFCHVHAAGLPLEIQVSRGSFSGPVEWTPGEAKAPGAR